ncbi:translation initiation factor IF-2-like [Neomonachus schauinslandi]|uniref:Translation initiation factor IF-2-like n=1 Tax=Neomonachus schauinslandi TaxID=29088 RepID=A0A8M1MN08_NEOSC|nr:translation initiation factor IF-2-like [Neomonachus schauinslandi]
MNCQALDPPAASGHGPVAVCVAAAGLGRQRRVETPRTAAPRLASAAPGPAPSARLTQGPACQCRRRELGGALWRLGAPSGWGGDIPSGQPSLGAGRALAVPRVCTGGVCHSPQPAPSVPEQMVLLAGGLPRALGVLAGCASPCLSASLGPRSQGNWIGPRGGGGDLSMWAWAPEVLILPRGSSVPSTPEPKPGWHAMAPPPSASGTLRARDRRAGTRLCALEGRRPLCASGAWWSGPLPRPWCEVCFSRFPPWGLHPPPTVSGPPPDAPGPAPPSGGAGGLPAASGPSPVILVYYTVLISDGFNLNLF